MTKIFISHSSRNNDKAIEVDNWLAANGWKNEVFLDLDPERGIVAGQRWKEALQKAAYRCEVVLALVSAEWLESAWSKSETDAARLMGKKIIVALIGIDKNQVPGDLTDEQFIDLSGDPQAWSRLKEGLKHAGLDPLSFPFAPGRRPYPGFAYFEEQDAAVFFGRDAQIVRGLDEIRRLVRTGVSRMLVILGASGSGKSSFLRAGLWPRLKRDDRAWLPLPIIRPERAVISGTYGLAAALRHIISEPRFAGGFRQRGLPRSRADIEDFIKTEDGLVKLFDALRDIGQVPGLSGENTSPPTIVLGVDQGEELFNKEGRDEAERFVEILTRTLTADPRTLAISAMRSDSFPLVQAHPSLAALPKDTFTLDMMLEGSYRAVIEEPARLIQPTALRIDPQLTEALLEEISGQDALPLLAFTLAHLYENYAADNELTLSGYDRLGRVKGVIDTAVKQAFALGVAKGELPQDAKAQLELARAAFIPHLAQVNAAGQFVRQVATLDRIPADARPLIDSFAEQRLLIKDRRKGADGNDADVVEVAHEALLRQPPFSEWLEEDREFLIDKQQLQNDLRDWQAAKPADKKAALLTGLRLSRMRAWLETRPQELTPEERAFGEASLAQADAEERRKARQRRIITRASIFAAVVLACFAVTAGVEWRIANKNAQQAQLARDKTQVKLLASEARRAAAVATSPNDIELAGALALASIAKSHKLELVPETDAIEAARSALIRLPLKVLSSGDDTIESLAVLADGRLASAGVDRTIKLWPTDGGSEPVVLSPGSRDWLQADERLRDRDKPKAVLADGLLATAGKDGQIKIWRKGGEGIPVAVLQGAGGEDSSLVALPNGGLASVGGNGLIKLWSKDFRDSEDFRDEPAVLSLGFGDAVTSLAVLPDGRLASGGIDGLITLLPTDNSIVRNGDPLVLFHDDNPNGGNSGQEVKSLAVLPDGRLASAGVDRTIKLWPTGAVGEPVVLSQGSGDTGISRRRAANSDVDAVESLAVLSDGRVVSAGSRGGIKLWPIGTGDPVVLLHDSWGATSLAVLQDGRLASGSGDDGNIKIWSKDFTGEPKVLSQGSEVTSLAVLRDGRLASGSGDGNIKIWSKNFTGEPKVLSQGSGVTSLAVLQDGRLASGSEDGNIKIWSKDVKRFTDKPEKSLPVGSQVASLAALADGRLASGGDGSIKLWSKDFTGEPVVLSQGSGRSIQSLVGLPDGWMASGDEEGVVKLWSTKDRGETVVLSGPGSPGHFLFYHFRQSGVSSLAVLPDGRLMSAGFDGGIKLWLVNEKELIATLCLRAGRNLTKDEWDRYIGSDAPWQPSCQAFGVPSNWKPIRRGSKSVISE